MKKGQAESYIPESLLLEFSDYLNKNMGLFYPERAWSEFEKKIPKISSSFGFNNQCECIEWIIKQPVTKDLISSLAQHLTIGETYFFRDKDTFDILQSKVLESLIHERRASHHKQLKIWSAACCTGEEPYTIAMILSEMLPNRRDWNISILGSDINVEFLRKAKRGIYRDWALRAIPQAYLKKYFQREDEGYAISPAIKKMVRFTYLNLIEDQYPSLINGTNNVDLVLCNNVLIYFSEQQSRRVISQLNKSLVDGGYLAVTPVEAALVNSPNLELQTGTGYNIFRSNKSTISEREKLQSRVLGNVSADIRNKKTNIRKKSAFFESFLQRLPDSEKLSKSIGELGNEKAFDTYVNKLYQLGDYETVVEEIEGFLSEKQHGIADQFSLIKILIKALVNTGNIDQAKCWCEKSLLQDTTNPTLHYLHAAIFQEYNSMEEAVSSLKKAIFLDGNFSIAYFTLGNILLTQDDFFGARKHFRNTMMTLDKLDDGTIVPETEELTVGRLKEIVQNILIRL